MGSALLPATARAAKKLNEKEYFELAHREVLVPDLDPAHDGLRVAQLSDIHVGSKTPDGRIIRAVRAVNAERPDLVVMTGDFVTVKSDPRWRIPELLGGLTAPTFAVLGNHDHWTDPKDVRERLESMGTAVLQNQCTTVRLKGAAFTIYGMDDSTTRNDDPQCTFKSGFGAGSRLALTHTPTGARKLPENKSLLCLSGHTHGGQLHVPGLTELMFRRFGQPYLRGLYPVNGNQLYVNRGLGFGKGTNAPRLDSDPEVTVLTLRRYEPKAA